MITLTDKEIAIWKAIRDQVLLDMERWSTEHGEDLTAKGVREALQSFSADIVDRKVHRT